MKILRSPLDTKNSRVNSFEIFAYQLVTMSESCHDDLQKSYTRFGIGLQRRLFIEISDGY